MDNLLTHLLTGLSDYDRNNIDISSIVKPLLYGSATSMETDEAAADSALASEQTANVLNCIMGNVLGSNNINSTDYSNHAWKLYRGTRTFNCSVTCSLTH